MEKIHQYASPVHESRTNNKTVFINTLVIKIFKFIFQIILSEYLRDKTCFITSRSVDSSPKL